MRIWIDPEKCPVITLHQKDVQDALREQNVEAAPGKIGENAEGIYEYVNIKEDFLKLKITRISL
jgi:HAE1 family hydrophobic/amphiphilic exporter-1